MAYYSKTKKIICKNSYGYKLEFGYSFPFYLNSYSGIHNYDGSVATIKSAFGVGVSYVGTSVNKRSINLVIAFKDDINLITRKQQIYNIFPLKDLGTLFYYEGNIERKINYYVETVDLVRKGEILAFENTPYLERAEKIMQSKNISVNINMFLGDGEATAWGCDLTYDYVKINAEYTT